MIDWKVSDTEKMPSLDTLKKLVQSLREENGNTILSNHGALWEGLGN